MLNFLLLPTLRSFINIFFLLVISTTSLLAQQDSVKKPVDSLRWKKFRPTGVRFGTDVISIIKSSSVKTFSGWEANMDVDFNRYYLAVDYGKWARTYDSDAGSYSNDGSYWRAGIDVNFLTKDPEKNMFFFGARYANSSFSEDAIVVVNDELWGGNTEALSNPGMKAHWFELTTGLRVKMWRFFWMGYTARFKFGLKTDESGVMLASDVPGYGRADGQSYWGFNYQLLFRIPIMKDRAVQTTDTKAK